MNEYTKVNNIDLISAMIFDGKQHIGSASLLWSKNKENLYCITANHCTSSENTDYDVKIKQKISNVEIEFNICGEKIVDKDNDIAIFTIQKSNDTSTIPYTTTFNFNYRPQEVIISGYPQKLNQTRKSLSANVMSNFDCNKINLKLPDLDSDCINRFDEINGISGAGCYEVIDDIVRFFGIENKAISKDVEFKEVCCTHINVINNLLKENNLEELPEAIPYYMLRRIGKYSSVSEMLATRNFKNQWVDISYSDYIKSRILEYFSAKNTSCLFICGNSGIGKTRGILNACYENGYNQALYYKSFPDFRSDLSNLLQYATKNGDILYIIVDEVLMNEWRMINDELYEYFGLIRIVLIGTLSADKAEDACEMLHISSCNEEDVKKIIAAQHPMFTEAELKSIYNLSLKDLRLALLISRLYEEEKRNDSLTNIITAPSSKLYDNYSSAKDILDRTLLQSKASIPKNFELDQYFSKLSLFVDIGFNGQNKSEIEAISDFFEEDISGYLRAIDYLCSVELGIKKEQYFEASPRALAKLSFEQDGWESIKYRIDKFMEAIPNELMRRRFFDRVDECSMKKEVNEALASWFCNKYSKCNVESLNYVNVAEIAMYIEHNPNDGLTWLKKIISSARDEEIRAFGTTISSPRRHLVWACEHLANFKEYFFDCEEILYKLAINESETVISNNSQGVWSGFFSILLSNTDVSFFERYDILINRIKECNQDSVELFSKALNTAFINGHTRWLPPKKIGGKITPPHWEPKSIEEFINAKKYSINKIQENFSDFKPFVQEIIIEALIENIYSFIELGLLNEYMEIINTIINDKKHRNKLIIVIENQVKHLKYQDKDEGKYLGLLRELNSWIEKLRDITFEGRLSEFLSRNVWSYGHTDKDKKVVDQLVLDIAKDFSLLSNKTVLLEKILNEDDYDKDSMERLARKLALFDEKLDFYSIIKFVSDKGLDNSFLRGYYTGYYDKESVLPKQLLVVLEDIKLKNPDFVLWASAVFDISEEGYNRIINIIPLANNIFCIENLKYKLWDEYLSIQQKINLCNMLSDCKNPHAYRICFDLLHGWISNGETNDELCLLAISIFKKSLDEKSQHALYHVVELFKIFPEKFETVIIPLLIGLFDFNDKYSNANGYVCEYIDEIKNDNNEELILRELGRRLVASNSFLKGPALRGFFERFSVSAVIEWINSNAEERAPLVAYHLSSPNLQRTTFSQLTEVILDKYNKFDSVYNNFILGEYNFVVYSPSEYYEHQNEWFDLLQQLETTEVVNIKKWCDYKKQTIINECEMHKQQMAEDARYE